MSLCSVCTFCRDRKEQAHPTNLHHIIGVPLKACPPIASLSGMETCNASDCKSLQRIVREAEKVIGVPLPPQTFTKLAANIGKDCSHPLSGTLISSTVWQMIPKLLLWFCKTVQQFYTTDHQNSEWTKMHKNVWSLSSSFQWSTSLYTVYTFYILDFHFLHLHFPLPRFDWQVIILHSMSCKYTQCNIIYAPVQ